MDLVSVIQFAFVVLLPIVLVAGGLLTLFAVGALLYALEQPAEVKDLISGAFRRPPAPPKEPGPEHYYKPYWAARS